MANIFYNAGKDALMNGSIGDMTSGTNIKLALIATGYSPQATHTWANVSSSVVAGSSVNLLTKTVSGAIFDAADVTITGLGSGISVTGYVVYFDNGTNQYPLVYVDTGTGLTFTTNGGNIIITFSGSGIFKL